MALYSNLVAFIDGILLANNTKVTYEIPDADQVVTTIPLGFAGLSPSPDVATITASNAMPAAGEDYDFEGAKLNRTEVEIKLQQTGSGTSLVTRGYITSTTRNGGVGETATYDFTAKVQAKAFG